LAVEIPSNIPKTARRAITLFSIAFNLWDLGIPAFLLINRSSPKER